MKPASLIILAVVLPTLLPAQNLVINGSFEDHFRCPKDFTVNAREFVLPGWRSANTGTPDYFHQCSWGECDVPFNWAGESNAHSGLGYAGIYVWNRPSSTPRSYREYLQGELTEPLAKGKRYRIEFYFKLASYSVYSADRIGLLLTDTVKTYKNDQPIPEPPTLSVIRPEPIMSAGWDIARMEYEAKGGERSIVIGNFFDNLTTQFTQMETRKGKSPMLNGSAYFYVDDVSVISLEPEPPPLLWTDGRVVKPEETYVLKHIQFEFAEFALLPESFPELDRLVEILKGKGEWKAELSGHTDDVGSDEYNLELSRNRANSVGQYLVAKGIDEKRLTIHWFGSQKPLVPSKDEAARSQNRRVEVRFLK